jgi:hypothetical protein
MPRLRPVMLKTVLSAINNCPFPTESSLYTHYTNKLPTHYQPGEL